MGIVLRGQDVRDGRLVAIKTARLQRSVEATGIRREIAVLGQISHPGIVRLIADGASDDAPWMAMELLHGRTLCERVAAMWRKRAAAPATPPPAAGGRLGEALRIVADVGRALDCLHGHGLVHRDVKPANVFMGDDGRVTLLDFGLVCVAARGAVDLEPCMGVGTIEYAAPEQIRGEAVDARADIYSLGCLLYELVSGNRPADAVSSSGPLGQPPTYDPVAPSALVSGVPPELESLLLAMLAQRREDRPASAREVADRLERIARPLD